MTSKPPRALSFYLKNEREITVTWNEVEHQVLNIVRQLRRDKFEPDVIVSMARSGLIPAALSRIVSAINNVYH